MAAVCCNNGSVAVCVSMIIGKRSSVHGGRVSKHTQRVVAAMQRHTQPSSQGRGGSCSISHTLGGVFLCTVFSYPAHPQHTSMCHLRRRPMCMARCPHACLQCAGTARLKPYSMVDQLRVRANAAAVAGQALTRDMWQRVLQVSAYASLHLDM